MANSERPDFADMSIRNFGAFIRTALEFTPQEEAEVEEAVERVRTRIHDLPLGQDVSVLEEQIPETS